MPRVVFAQIDFVEITSVKLKVVKELSAGFLCRAESSHTHSPPGNRRSRPPCPAPCRGEVPRSPRKAGTERFPLRTQQSWAPPVLPSR